ncbi:hypothetical protein MHBO_000806 [Bonamia ostreae]|uniref:Uncharacterized protein n=1 Tax=Bonamia ostreae TaxID=126728 RepID=A0ABV2AGX3_9EUKA
MNGVLNKYYLNMACGKEKLPDQMNIGNQEKRTNTTDVDMDGKTLSDIIDPLEQEIFYPFEKSNMENYMLKDLFKFDDFSKTLLC